MKHFHGDNIPKEGSQWICIPVVLIDSHFRKGKNYYPQVFLEECKYIVMEKEMPKYITENLVIYFEEEYSDEKNHDEKVSDDKISDEKNYSEE